MRGTAVATLRRNPNSQSGGSIPKPSFATSTGAGRRCGTRMHSRRSIACHGVRCCRAALRGRLAQGQPQQRPTNGCEAGKSTQGKAQGGRCGHEACAPPPRADRGAIVTISREPTFQIRHSKLALNNEAEKAVAVDSGVRLRVPAIPIALHAPCTTSSLSCLKMSFARYSRR